MLIKFDINYVIFQFYPIVFVHSLVLSSFIISIFYLTITIIKITYSLTVKLVQLFFFLLVTFCGNPRNIINSLKFKTPQWHIIWQTVRSLFKGVFKSAKVFLALFNDETGIKIIMITKIVRKIIRVEVGQLNRNCQYMPFQVLKNACF